VPNRSELAQQACDAYLETLSQTQEATLKAVAAFAAHTPQTPNPEVLLTAPGAILREIASTTFDFAAKLVANQRAYAQRLLAITEDSSRNSEAARPHPAGDNAAQVVRNLRGA
jgi:hypothetical protein